MSKLSFKTFCIEYYAQHIGKPGNEVYDWFVWAVAEFYFRVIYTGDVQIVKP